MATGQCNRSRSICQHFCFNLARNLLKCGCRRGYRLQPDNRSCGRDVTITSTREPVTSHTSPLQVSTNRGRRSVMYDMLLKRQEEELEKLQGIPKYIQKNAKDTKKKGYRDSMFKAPLKHKGTIDDRTAGDVKGNNPASLLKQFPTYKSKMVDTKPGQKKKDKNTSDTGIGRSLCNDCKDNNGLQAKKSESKEEFIKEDDMTYLKHDYLDKHYFEDKLLAASSFLRKMENADKVPTKAIDSFQEPQKNKEVLNPYQKVDVKQKETAKFLKKTISNGPFQEKNPLEKDETFDSKQQMPYFKDDTFLKTLKTSENKIAPNFFTQNNDKPVGTNRNMKEQKQVLGFKEYTKSDKLKYFDLRKDNSDSWNHKHEDDIETREMFSIRGHKFVPDLKRMKEKQQPFSYLKYNKDLHKANSKTQLKEKKHMTKGASFKPTESISIPKYNTFSENKMYNVFNGGPEKFDPNMENTKDKAKQLTPHSSEFSKLNFLDKSEYPKDPNSSPQPETGKFQDAMREEKYQFPDLPSNSKDEYSDKDKKLSMMKQYHLYPVKSSQNPAHGEQKQQPYKFTTADDHSFTSKMKAEMTSAIKGSHNEFINLESEKSKQMAKNKELEDLKKLSFKEDKKENLQGKPDKDFKPFEKLLRDLYTDKITEKMKINKNISNDFLTKKFSENKKKYEQKFTTEAVARLGTKEFIPFAKEYHDKTLHAPATISDSKTPQIDKQADKIKYEPYTHDSSKLLTPMSQKHQLVHSTLDTRTQSFDNPFSKKESLNYFKEWTFMIPDENKKVPDITDTDKARHSAQKGLKKVDTDEYPSASELLNTSRIPPVESFPSTGDIGKEKSSTIEKKQDRSSQIMDAFSNIKKQEQVSSISKEISSKSDSLKEIFDESNLEKYVGVDSKSMKDEGTKKREETKLFHETSNEEHAGTPQHTARSPFLPFKFPHSRELANGDSNKSPMSMVVSGNAENQKPDAVEYLHSNSKFDDLRKLKDILSEQYKLTRKAGPKQYNKQQVKGGQDSLKDVGILTKPWFSGHEKPSPTKSTAQKGLPFSW